ncbi:GNAT family N-acetyltransferase [Enterococcus sp. AZ072]|uniref:GNAT family N-acetyltransferase n=1 Tax=unclassified Enterococcus TaxID=2608891 RepID=UPI003D281DD7
MEIREANQSELRPFLAEIFAEQYRQFFSQEMKEEKEIALGAWQEDQLLGGITAKYQYQTLHVSMLAVDNNSRHSGVGSQLLKAMEQKAFSLGMNTITLTTKEYQAADFYLKNGYQKFAQLEDVPMTGMTKYYFVKRRK